MKIALTVLLCAAGLVNAAIQFGDTVKVTERVDKFTVLGTGTPDEAWLGIVGPLAFDFASVTLGPAAGTGGSMVNTDYAPEYLYFAYPAPPAPGSWIDGVLFTVDIRYNGQLPYSIVHGDKPDAVAKVFLYGPDGVAVVDTMSYVPEPMTLGFLAVGSLFLKKRK